jgi:hypothetical protein
MTATIAIYLKFISGNWRGHSVYLH